MITTSTKPLQKSLHAFADKISWSSFKRLFWNFFKFFLPDLFFKFVLILPDPDKRRIMRIVIKIKHFFFNTYIGSILYYFFSFVIGVFYYNFLSCIAAPIKTIIEEDFVVENFYVDDNFTDIRGFIRFFTGYEIPYSPEKGILIGPIPDWVFKELYESLTHFFLIYSLLNSFVMLNFALFDGFYLLEWRYFWAFYVLIHFFYLIFFCVWHDHNEFFWQTTFIFMTIYTFFYLKEFRYGPGYGPWPEVDFLEQYQWLIICLVFIYIFAFYLISGGYVWEDSSLKNIPNMTWWVISLSVIFFSIIYFKYGHAPMRPLMNILSLLICVGIPIGMMVGSPSDMFGILSVSNCGLNDEAEWNPQTSLIYRWCLAMEYFIVVAAFNETIMLAWFREVHELYPDQLHVSIPHFNPIVCPFPPGYEYMFFERLKSRNLQRRIRTEGWQKYVDDSLRRMNKLNKK